MHYIISFTVKTRRVFKQRAVHVTINLVCLSNAKPDTTSEDQFPVCTLHDISYVQLSMLEYKDTKHKPLAIIIILPSKILNLHSI